MMRVHGFDPHTPSIARVYDYLLGGKDHFAVDREIGEELVEIYPGVRGLVAANRRFLTRAVDWAADQGARQFIDLGCGMPTEPSTHETAQAVRPGARVAYVDVDPVALTHLRAFAEHGNDAVTVAWGDARDVGAVIKAVSAGIDVSAPVCLVMGCLLHFFAADEARALVADYAAALAPGSYLVLSVGRGDGPRADAFLSAYSDSAAKAYNHTAREIAGFFGRLPLVPPGVVAASDWHPDTGEIRSVPLHVGQMVVGVARVDG
jgi:O-methyltransferase involved in polyketide biosynthesis